MVRSEEVNVSRQWMLLAFLLIALPASAQRALTMNIEFRNSNSSSLYVVVSKGLTRGRIDCDPEPSTIRWINPASTARMRCVAYAFGSRDVWVKFAGHNNRKEVVNSAVLRVYGPTHEFKCYKGCTIHDRWNCGDTGPCSVAIEVITDRLPRPGS
jgi:hypothetical protein